MEVLVVIFVVIAALIVVCARWELDTKRVGEAYETEYYALEAVLELEEKLWAVLTTYPARQALEWDWFLSKIDSLTSMLASLPSNCPTRSYIRAVVQTGQKAQELLEQPRPINVVAIAQQAVAAAESAQQHSSVIESRIQELIAYFEKKFTALNPGLEWVTGPQLQEFHLARAQLNNARNFATDKVPSLRDWGGFSEAFRLVASNLPVNRGRISRELFKRAEDAARVQRDIDLTWRQK